MNLAIIKINMKVVVIFIKFNLQQIGKIINRQKIIIIDKMEKNIIKN